MTPFFLILRSQSCRLSPQDTHRINSTAQHSTSQQVAGRRQCEHEVPDNRKIGITHSQSDSASTQALSIPPCLLILLKRKRKNNPLPQLCFPPIPSSLRRYPFHVFAIVKLMKNVLRSSIAPSTNPSAHRPSRSYQSSHSDSHSDAGRRSILLTRNRKHGCCCRLCIHSASGNSLNNNCSCGGRG